MLTSRDCNWLAALSDDQAFAAEQQRLRSHWTLVAFTSELSRNNDWIRADLHGRSIFVQNFDGALRGFVNSCAHRQFPIRNENCGNGPVRCPFHHWVYDKAGRAVGIPMSKDLFGGSPRTLEAQLETVDIDTCGAFVFARLTAGVSREPGEGPSVAEWLGPAAPILSYFTSGAKPEESAAYDIAANWRLSVHMTLDDYHLVAVHPSTFGKDGYLKGDLPRYYRFGPHSAYFTEGDAGELERMSKACADGTYSPGGYRIFSLFPNLTVIQIAAMHRWYIVVIQHQPMARDRTSIRAAFFEAPFARSETAPVRILDAALRPVRRALFGYYFGRILREDNQICEQHQKHVAQSQTLPILGAHEERIAWFENAYRDLVGDPSVPDLMAVSGPNSFGGPVTVRP